MVILKTVHCGICPIPNTLIPQYLPYLSASNQKQMAPIKLLIIEDNPLHLANISMLIEMLGYEVAGTANNATDALELVFTTQADIILMDIELIGDEDGISLAERINRVRPIPIIFTTGLKDKNIFQRASEVKHSAYLVKPIEESNLMAAIELALFRAARDVEKALPEVATHQQDAPTEKAFFQNAVFIKSGSRLVKIRFEDILTIEVLKDRYCQITTADDTYIIRISLKNILEQLPKAAFLQIHRAHIVNAQAIESVDEVEGYIFIKKRAIPIGKSFKQELLNNWMRQW